MHAVTNKRNNVDCASSLVCDTCWSRLFAFDSFQAAWRATRLFNGFTYTTTFSEVDNSAEKGCNWCRILVANRDSSTLEEEFKVTINFSRQMDGNDCTPKGLDTLRLIINNVPNCVFYVYTTAEDPASTYLHARDLVLDISSSSSYRLATDCISQCALYHERCPKPWQSTLPTRVIDCLDPQNPKLIICGDMKGFYVALSYVWGEEQPHSTCTTNIDSYVTSGFGLQLLPNTIRDAIVATHRFGVQYLWVDSLCIIQDSREDKDLEIPQMRRIFQNAYVTLIAASAQKVSEGFLQCRQSPSPDVRLPFICPNGEIGTMALSPVWKQYDETQESVNNRAWCLEERLLSPRALIYASHTLQYHCQTETVNIGNSICAPRSGRRLPSSMFLPNPPSSLSNKEISEIRRVWYDIIEDYTRRAVTKPRDKLLALSGVVDRFHHVWGGQYLAGLWEHSIIRDLLWLKDYNDHFPRPVKYRSPSWSWAAVDGRVVVGHLDDRLNRDFYSVEECEILGCELSLANNHLPFGRVTGGILNIRGPLKRVIWSPGAEWPEIFEPLAEGNNSAFQKGICIGCAYADSAEEVSQKINEAWALPVQWSVESKYAEGLIVVPSQVDGQYRRVGYFSSPKDSEDISWLKESPAVTIMLI